MTIKFENVKKNLVSALAAVCLLLTFSNSSEAAVHHQSKVPPHHAAVHSQDLDKHMDNAIFFRHKVPSGHKQCHNPRHSKMAPHFHCANPHHRHHESKDLCRYDRCHNKHPFK